MPFTPSHAVVALPFLRTPLLPAAVAVGAMSPDLPLFLRGMPLTYALTHAWSWFPVTLGVAVVLLAAWRAVLRPVARELSPDWFAARLPADWDGGTASSLRELFGSVRGAIRVVVSVAIGIGSHIVWDQFTHEGRWGSHVIPALDQLWGPLHGYRWLQHGSSLFGLIVLAVWGAAWLGSRSPGPVTRTLPGFVRAAWWVALPALLLAALAVGIGVWGMPGPDLTVAQLAYRTIPPACGVFGIVTLVVAGLTQAVRASQRASSAPHSRGVR